MFSNEKILRCALEHNVVLFGLNIRSKLHDPEDVRAAWADPEDLQQVRRAAELLSGVRTVKTKLPPAIRPMD